MGPVEPEGKAPFSLPRIMLIEDDPLVGEALKRAIERAGMQTCWAVTGAEAMALKTQFQPNVVLVDLELPDINGVDLIRLLVKAEDCGVIVVSGAGDDTDRIIGLELGADDYVAKPPNMRELLARIRAVHRRLGQRAAAATTGLAPLTVGDMRIDMAGRTVHRADGGRIALTAAEYTALETLCAAKGQLVSRDTLSETALHRPWRAEDRSVDQLILSLRQKLPKDTDGQSLIQSVRGGGYLLRMTAAASA